jgi:uncharacterized protein DUF5372
LERRRQWGVDIVIFRESAEQPRRFIPVAWTDLMESDPWVEVSGGRSSFRWPDLLRLADLVRELSCQGDFAVSGKEISPGLDRRTCSEREIPTRSVGRRRES